MPDRVDGGDHGVGWHDSSRPGSATLEQDGCSTRQCGRCRKVFDGGPAKATKAKPDWWLCTTCRRALLGTPDEASLTGGRPPERAQVVWGRALELARRVQPSDRFAHALDLLRTAHHDPAAMAHALSIGRTHLRTHRDDPEAGTGAAILEAAIAFLGVRPRAGDVARPTTLRVAGPRLSAVTEDNAPGRPPY